MRKLGQESSFVLEQPQRAGIVGQVAEQAFDHQIVKKIGLAPLARKEHLRLPTCGDLPNQLVARKLNARHPGSV